MNASVQPLAQPVPAQALAQTNAAANASLQTPDEPGTPAFAGALFWVAVAFSTFQIVTAAFSPLSSTVVRAVHVGFLLLVTFVLYPPLRQRLRWNRLRQRLHGSGHFRMPASR